MWYEFEAERLDLIKRLQSREIFALSRVDFAEDYHVIPVRDIIEHDETLSCECLPFLARNASTGLTGESIVVIHRPLVEIIS